MSGDPEQEYFTDGITEDIITELSRFHSLFVIARNSSFSYKGKSPDIRQVGRELGVRYVLEGSIRKSSNRIRVTGQLIDTLTGNHIWAERYDRVLEDIFAVQEEVTRAIVAAIAPQIEVTEQSKAARRRPDNLSAYEIALLAWAHAWQGYDTADRALLIRRFARRETRWRSTRGACWPCIQLPMLAEVCFLHDGRGSGACPSGSHVGGRARDRTGQYGCAWLRAARDVRSEGRPGRSLSRSARGCSARPRDESQRCVCAWVSCMAGSCSG